MQMNVWQAADDSAPVYQDEVIDCSGPQTSSRHLVERSAALHKQHEQDQLSHGIFCAASEVRHRKRCADGLVSIGKTTDGSTQPPLRHHA